MRFRNAWIVLLFLAAPLRASDSGCSVTVQPSPRGGQSPLSGEWEANLPDCALMQGNMGSEVRVTTPTWTRTGPIGSGIGTATLRFKLYPPPPDSDLTNAQFAFQMEGKWVSWRVRATRSNAPQQTAKSPVRTQPKPQPSSRPPFPSATPSNKVDDDIIGLGMTTDLMRPIAINASGDLVYRESSGWEIRERLPFKATLPLTSATGFGVIDHSGRAWATYASTPSFPVTALQLNGREFWAVGNGGTIAKFDGDKDEWNKLSTSIRADLRNIALDNNSHICVVGAKGFIATSDDAGKSWTERGSQTDVDLNGVDFGLEGVLYAAGERGIVLRSSDYGKTWTHVTAEWNPDVNSSQNSIPFPPPWYILFNAFVTLPLLGIASRSLPGDDDVEESDSVAEVLGSDRPLERGDPDPMNLRAIALAISRFLRNENTMPPLTIAVTGEWGSGKSSLMNLLRADLTDFGFRPVWFNAWHNQKEEHLLASLLQAIRDQAVPHWWRPEAFFFRLKLIWIRGWKNRAKLLLIILLVSMGIGFEARHGHDAAGPITEAIQKIAEQKDFDLTKIAAGLGHEWAYIATLLTIIGFAVRGLRAFRVDPAALLASISGSAKINDLSAEISFRHKFANEFNDVTKALGARSLLIFIDDLDRCKPESVRDILEAVNFLVSSGDCFVVMGMDRLRVERYVNVSFKEIALGEADFATKYLDKLINIEVPVPEPSETASEKILNPGDGRDATRPSMWQIARKFGFDTLRFWPIAIAIAIAIVGYRSGRGNEPETLPPPPETLHTATLLAVTATTTATSSTTVATDTAPQLPTRTDQPADIVKASSSGSGAVLIYWPAILFLFPLAGVAWWLLTRPPELVIRDSPVFAAALSFWHGHIIARNRTPRSLKRFMNRIRYLAMRQRPQTEDLTLWRQLRMKLRGEQIHPEDAKDDDAIPDSALVALATLEHYPDDEDTKRLIALHEGKFHDNLTAHRNRYREVASAVRAN